jgi:hypothetical protein
MPTDNPTNSEPIEWKRGDPTRRCVAHKKDGEQCRRWAIRGGVVCQYHGGSAPQVLAKARENMALAADHNRSNVQRLADAAESEQVRLQASNSLIDRVLGRPTTMVEIGPKEQAPWEELLGDVAHITRAQHEAMKRGDYAPAAQPALPAPAAVVDAEVVDAPVSHAERVGERADGPPVPDWAEPPPAAPSSRELVTLEDAAAEVAAANRRAGVSQRKQNRS